MAAQGGDLGGFAGVRIVGVVAAGERGATASVLEPLTAPRAARAALLGALRAATGAAELVYLATCNRVEVALRFAPELGPAGAAELPRRVLALLAGAERLPASAGDPLDLGGEAAVRHLFEVAAGLDSAVLGEREIQGQLRAALAEARRAGTAGGLLDRLIEEALRVARRVHLRTELGAGRVSLAEIAGELLVARVRRTPSPVALVGVSAMTRRAAEILARERVPVVVVNRTLARAERLVAELGEGSCQALDDFRRRPPRVEALLAATRAPGPVLDRAALQRLAARTSSREPPLVVDLAVPPDVDPEAARAAEVPRVGLDELNGVARGRREGRRAAAAAARRLLDEALADLARRLAERALAPVVAEINRRYRATALQGVERLCARRGLALEGEEREAVERWAETLARRFAHLPTLGLRGLAAEHGRAAVESFLAASGGDALADLLDLGARAGRS